MKDILKIMRFDYLTAKPFAVSSAVIVVVICFALSLFFSPMICAYITFGALMFVIPLHKSTEKSDLQKLYGILPVHRKNIARGRFLYIFLILFVSEILELILSAAAMSLKLYKIIPNQNSELMQMVRNSFDDKKLILLMIFGLFAFLCLIFSYIEMMGQIYGRENEFKILLITFGIITVLCLIFMILVSNDIIPPVNLPSLPDTVHGMLLLGAVLDIVSCGICFVFGEITASKLAELEL